MICPPQDYKTRGRFDDLSATVLQNPRELGFVEPPAGYE